MIGIWKRMLSGTLGMIDNHINESSELIGAFFFREKASLLRDAFYGSKLFSSNKGDSKNSVIDIPKPWHSS